MRAIIAFLGLVVTGTTLADVIVCPPDAPSNLKLAAKEIRRYVYLRTGELLPVAESGRGIVLKLDPSLEAQQYRLRTSDGTLTISGGSDIAVLYGAYAFSEKLGVRFYLHGDVIPDEKVPFVLPLLDETHKPRFELRGIQPFHDFPEGPDWWSTDDYRCYLSQLAKLRMNFIGFHNYPSSFLLWHGVAEDVNPDGTVKTTYPSQWKWFDNATGGFGYAALKTSEFTAGAAELFPTDYVFPEVARSDNRIFDRVARMLGIIVREAHARGIKVAVGTETPLSIGMPDAVQARLKELNKTNAAHEVYKGTFTWLMRNAPVDYYWAWTSEAWIWHGNSMSGYKAVEADLKAALSALGELGDPFPLGACGWVIGPQQDRAAWDKLLPKNAPIANINPMVAHAPIDPGFSSIEGRPKWAIPWLENDADMIAYQPWVKRLRYDAADALRRGCTGLMGIHWRTKIIAPNIAALAQAGWDHSWAREERLLPATRKRTGTAVAFSETVTGTEQSPIYQTLRFDLDGYPVEVPNGNYTVTLKFCEPHHEQTRRRVFSVYVQDRQVAEHLDIFRNHGGRNHAYDVAVPNVRVEHGVVDITFVPEVEYPLLCGVEITGTTFAVNQMPARPYARRINVGGPAWGSFEADPIKADDYLNRAMPAEDFYRDFACAQFGKKVAEKAANILIASDGFPTAFKPRYPRFSGTSEWQAGPGSLRVIREPWGQFRAAHYAFVEEFAALRSQVEGIGNRERFDYWLNTFRATELMAKLACQRGVLDAAVEKMQAEKDPVIKRHLVQAALDSRRQLARGWEELIRLEIRLVSTPGELGTIANLEMHSRVNNQWLTVHDKALAEALGASLPPDCQPTQTYAGPARLILPTVRGAQHAGEALALRILALDRQPVKSVSAHFRPLGAGKWEEIPATHFARAVWDARLPAVQDDFEYYVTAETSGGQKLVWPATAPTLNQTVIVQE